MSIELGTGTNTERAKSPAVSKTDNETVNKVIRDLIKRRGLIKGRLTRFISYIDTSERTILSPQNKIDLKLRITGIEGLFAEYNIIQTQLEESVLDSDVEQQLTQRELFQNDYYSAVARGEYMIQKPAVNTSSQSYNPENNINISLPTVSIPTFDGTCEHWLEFRDKFLSLVHNSTRISNIQKYHYLKTSLIGRAALVIDSIEFSADNYPIAWEVLINRYNNNNLLIHKHVKALFNVQAITKESAESINNLIDSVLKNLRSLKQLGEPVDSWDTLIIYIIVSKLDSVTEREWKQFKNLHLKQLSDPQARLTINVLLSFLKDKAEMLETSLESPTSSRTLDKTKGTSSNAHNNYKIHCNVSTNNQPSYARGFCLFCNNRHPLYACTKFRTTDIDSRIKFIKDKNLCQNCLRQGHDVDNCRFGNCKRCNKNHNSLLICTMTVK